MHRPVPAAARAVLFAVLGGVTACATLGPPPRALDAAALALTDVGPGVEEVSSVDVDTAQVLARALAALGGEAAAARARVRTEEIERHAFTSGQSVAPGDPPFEAARTRVLQASDPAARALVVEERHRPVYPYPFPVEFALVEHLRSGHGFLRGEDDGLQNLAIFLPGRARPMSAARVAMREKLAWLSSPYEIVRAASAGRARRMGTVDVVTFAWRGLPMTARFDASGRLLDVTTLEDHPLLGGDVVVRVAFADWADSGLDTTEPRRVVHVVDGVVTLVDQVVARRLGAGRPEVPRRRTPRGSARAGLARAHYMLEWTGYGFPQDDAAEAPVVTIKEVATGVHVVAGGFHNSLVVELDPERLALVEAPFSSERVEAILAALAQRFPHHRVDAVVQSHWHLDHTAGLRAAVAHGLPIYAGAAGADVLARAAAKARTLVPDRLATSPQEARVTIVTAPLVIAGAQHQVELTPVQSLHARDLLIVRVPGPQIMFIADELNPGLATPGFMIRQILDVTVPFFLVKAGSYAADLEPYLATHAVRMIVGGHGDAVGTPEDVHALAAYADVPRLERMLAEHEEVP